MAPTFKRFSGPREFFVGASASGNGNRRHLLSKCCVNRLGRAFRHAAAKSGKADEKPIIPRSASSDSLLARDRHISRRFVDRLDRNGENWNLWPINQRNCDVWLIA